MTSRSVVLRCQRRKMRCFLRLLLVTPVLYNIILYILAFGDVVNPSAAGDEGDDRRLMNRCPGMCWCRFTTVNCSGRGSIYVPSDLPIETRFLYLDRNWITSLGESTTFRNLGSLQVLNLSCNRIRTLENKIFFNLGRLQLLDLSVNAFKAIRVNAFLGLSELQSLDLSFNPLPSLPHGLFSPLRSLTDLDLTSTFVDFVPEVFVNLTSLRRFFFRNNRLKIIPQFIHREASLFPNLIELHLDQNRLELISALGLDSLHFLGVASNKIDYMPHHTLINFQNLMSIDLRHNSLRHVEAMALWSTSLMKLDLGFSGFTISYETRHVFSNIPNLLELSLVNVRVNRAHHPFRQLPKLVKLNMECTGIGEEEAGNLLSDLKQLEWLSLSNNTIQKLNRGIFENFAATLKVLALGSNRITTLDDVSLPERLWTTLEYIDLSDNPFTCDCQLEWFLRWLSTTKVAISMWKSDPKRYQCSEPANLRARSLQYFEKHIKKQCRDEPKDWYLLVVFCFSLAASTLSTIGSVLYRFRWYAKYWYFKYKIQQRQDALSADDIRTHQYDAFVSYSKQDSKWVVTELRHHLETEEGLQLCIHDRDFQVGEDIVSNVISSIEQSRKVLFVVSNAFASSQWCHFELIMVQTRVLENDRDNLILILLEELDERNLSPRLKLQMERQTYLEWTSSGIGRQLFWNRLRQAVGCRLPESIVNAQLPIEMFRSMSS